MTSLDNLLTCSVCLGWLDNPKRLPCPHTFCLRCLQGIVQSGAATVVCPECRAEHPLPVNGVEGFVSDVRISSFLENLGTKTETASGSTEQLMSRFMKELNELHQQLPKNVVSIVQCKQKWQEICETIPAVKNNISRKIDNYIKELERTRTKLLQEVECRERSGLQLVVSLNLATEACEFYHSQMKNLVDNKFVPTDAVELGRKCGQYREMLSDFDTKSVTLPVRLGFDEENTLSGAIYYMEKSLFVPDIEYRKKRRVHAILNGSSSTDGFNGVHDVATCPHSGNIFISDDKYVHVYNPDFSFKFGFKTAASAPDISVSNTGKVVLSSYSDCLIYVYDTDGNFVCQFGSTGSQCSVECDSEGNIFLADGDNSRIEKFREDGTHVKTISEGVCDPGFLSLSAYGIAISDFAGDALFMLNDEGILRKFGEGFSKSPRGICVDRQGFISVAVGAKRINVFTPSGDYYCSISDPANPFRCARGMALTWDGKIACADRTLKKVLVF